MILAFDWSAVTVSQVFFALLVLQTLVAIAYRTSWVQAHAGVKAALEEEQKIAALARGALVHVIDNHEDGESVKALATDYLKKNGVEAMVSKVLEPPKTTN